MRISKNVNSMEKIKSERKVNWRVVIYSIIALICLVLVFTVDWLFIIPVAVLVWMNQRELMKK